MQTLADLNANKIPNVQNWRNQYKADLVQVIINNGEYCGFGNVMVSRHSSNYFAYSARCTKLTLLHRRCPLVVTFNHRDHTPDTAKAVGAVLRIDATTMLYY